LLQMRILGITALLLACSHLLAQQLSPISVPESNPTVIGGSVSQYEKTPPDLILNPRGAGARGGKLWIRNIGSGVLISGEVDGDAPDFPKNKNWILSKDHIEIWLAAATEVPMPPIGWGDQFAEHELSNEESCTKSTRETARNTADTEREEKRCREWFAAQQRYRSVFKRLFVRQWLLTDYYSIESYATPAYDEITAKFASDQPAFKEEVPEMLKPRGKVEVWISPNRNRGYTFQILIRYSSFPPLPALELRDFWLLVDVFSPAPAGKKMGPFSTSSPARIYGRPETFNHLQLEPARTFKMTGCDVGLTGTDKYGNDHPAWFIPHAGQTWEAESDAFLLVNESRGYQYLPDGLSPVVRPSHHFWQNVSPGEWICGPELAYRKGENFHLYPENVREEGFAAKRVSDDLLLIKSGPDAYGSEFGSGTCGACPRIDMRVFALDRNLHLSKALDLSTLLDNGDGKSIDFSVAADWSSVVQFDQAPFNDQGEPGLWSSTAWCLRGTAYERCGQEQNVQPPDPPLLQELRNPD